MIHDHPMILWPPFHWEKKMETSFRYESLWSQKAKKRNKRNSGVSSWQNHAGTGMTQGQQALQIKTNTMISWQKFTFFHNDVISDVISRMQHFFSWSRDSNRLLDHWIADLASTISVLLENRFSWGKYRVSIEVGRTWVPNLTWNTQRFPFPWHGSMAYPWLTFCGKGR